MRATELTGLAGVVGELVASKNTALIDRIVETVQTYFESEPLRKDPERVRALLAELRTVKSESLPAAWGELLDRTAERLVTAPDDPDETAATATESPAP